MVALFCSQALIYLLARYADLTVNAQSASILTVLVFGAGTDYALLLVARYREELRRHRDKHEAMNLACGAPGRATVWCRPGQRKWSRGRWNPGGGFPPRKPA